MPDVVYMRNRSRNWVFKGVTDAARAEMRRLLRMPPELIGEAFMSVPGEMDARKDGLVRDLERVGLTVEQFGTPDIRALTNF